MNFQNKCADAVANELDHIIYYIYIHISPFGQFDFVD